MQRRDFIHKNFRALTFYPYLTEAFLSTALPASPDDWKIDTHMHLFDLRQFQYPWLKNASAINRDFLLSDFDEATLKASVHQMIFMESGAAPEFSVAEAQWVSRLAGEDDRIRGIIAQCELGSKFSDNEKFMALQKIPLIKGVRGKFQFESPDFIDNLKQLGDRGWTLDLLLSYNQLDQAASIVSKAPGTRYILDHLGNPDYSEINREKWRSGIQALAELPNVHCKVSGMISRIGPDWKLEEIKPYFEQVLQSFGSDRLVFGGDWPVVLLGGSYQDWSTAFDQLIAQLTEPERRKISHENAARIYDL